MKICRGEEMNPEILRIFEAYKSLKDANILYGNYDLVAGFILLFIKNEKSTFNILFFNSLFRFFTN